FFAIRPAIAAVPFTGARFFLGDLTLTTAEVLGIALGVPVAAALAARLALRRVSVSPLGVTRRVTPRPPRVWRLVPLIAGLAELGYFVYAGRPSSTLGQIQAFLAGILLVMVGLVLAGPWLTFVGSRLIARRTGRPAVLIAGRRLADNPKAGFRAVSGLALALFVTSVAIGIMTTMSAYDSGGKVDAAGRTVLLDDFTYFRSHLKAPAVPRTLLTELRSVPGVHGVAVIRASSSTVRGAIGPGLMSCADLARVRAIGRCRPGAEVAMVDPYFGGRKGGVDRTAWPAADVAVAQLPSLPLKTIIVDAAGSSAALERSRTVLEQAIPGFVPLTIAEQQALNNGTRLLHQYQQLANVVIVASIAIAGCSLAVTVASGLNDRKRPFSLLRLSGASLRVLRRVVALESAVPLVSVAVLSIGIGFLTAGLFLKSQLDETLQPPGGSYYALVITGVVASLLIIASMLPLLERITGPDTARNE
ncbi:MAG TPA: FtsX-like permease family protein, partial [Jatrophihabitans sp.]|nr:FtsX-like permease family protein [Jatrophihabitans sp.]